MWRVQVESGAFNDCLLLGALGQVTFGDRLITDPTLPLSPFLLAGALPSLLACCGADLEHC